MDCFTFASAKEMSEGTILATFKKIGENKVELLFPWLRQNHNLDKEGDICVRVFKGESVSVLLETFHPYLMVLTLKELTGWCYDLAATNKGKGMIIDNVIFPVPT